MSGNAYARRPVRTPKNADTTGLKRVLSQDTLLRWRNGRPLQCAFGRLAHRWLLHTYASPFRTTENVGSTHYLQFAPSPGICSQFLAHIEAPRNVYKASGATIHSAHPLYGTYLLYHILVQLLLVRSFLSYRFLLIRSVFTGGDKPCTIS